MKWPLSQLKKYQDDCFEIDQTTDLKQFFQENNQDVLDATPVIVTGHFDVSPDEIVVYLKLTGEWTLPCARTLEPVVYPYEIKATETFVKEKEKLVDESFHLMEHDVVDLEPVIKELLLVEIPMQVFSPETSDEHLPKGTEWELKTEEQLKKERQKEKPNVDPRLAGLADFFEQNKDSE